MKKHFLLLIIACLSAITLKAQVPNNGFESWTPTGNYNEPDQWGTLNSLTSVAGIYTCTKGTPGNPGTSYIKLVSKNVTGFGVVPAIAVSGTLDTATLQPGKGFPFTQQPLKLSGNWQYMAYGSDQGYIGVYLTKWNSSTNTRDTVSCTVYNLPGMVMSWAAFNITLSYQSPAAPDSAMIVLSASSANGAVPAANSYIYIDNLSFTGSAVGMEEESIVKGLNIYPNPAAGRLNVEFNLESRELVTAKLLDVSGRLVKEVNAGEMEGESSFAIEAGDLAPGAYFLSVTAGEAVKVVKVFIQ